MRHFLVLDIATGTTSTVSSRRSPHGGQAMLACSSVEADLTAPRLRFERLRMQAVQGTGVTGATRESTLDAYDRFLRGMDVRGA